MIKKQESPKIKSYKDIISRNGIKTKIDTNIVKEHQNKYADVYNEVYSIASYYSQFFESYVRPDKINGLKNYLMFNWDRSRDLKSQWMWWKSNYKTAVTKIITDLYFSKIFSLDFSVQTRKRKHVEKDSKKEDIQDTEYTDKEIKSFDNKHLSNDEQQAFCDWAFTDSQVRHWLQWTIFDLWSTWEWYAFIDMNISQEMVNMSKYYANQIALGKTPEQAKINTKKKYFKIARVNTIRRYVSPFHVVYEYDRAFEQSAFVWLYMYEDINTFLDMFPFIQISDDVKSYILSSNTTIFWKDYNKIKMINSVEKLVCSWNLSAWMYQNSDWGYINIETWIRESIISNSNSLYWNVWYGNSNLNRKEFYLHYTKDTLTILCWDVVLYDWENPVWNWIIPIVRMAKENYWGVWHSKWTTQVLSSVQDQTDLIVNSWNDNIKMFMSPMFYTKNYANVEWRENWFIPLEWFRIYKWDLDEVKRLDLWNFDYNSLKLVDFYWQQAIMSVWLHNKYGIQYQQQRPEQTSWNANIALGIAQEPLKQIVSSVSLWMTKAFKIWSVLAQKCLPDNIKVTIEWDWWTAEERTVRIKNLLDNYDVVYTPESMIDYSFQTKINNLTQYANFLAIWSTDPTSGINYVDYEALNKEFANLLWIRWWSQTKTDFFDKKKIDTTNQFDIDKQKLEYEFEIEKLKLEKKKELAPLMPPDNQNPQGQWNQWGQQYWWNQGQYNNQYNNWYWYNRPKPMSDEEAMALELIQASKPDRWKDTDIVAEIINKWII